jgi:pullulanase
MLHKLLIPATVAMAMCLTQGPPAGGATGGVKPTLAAGTTILVVHYHRFNGDYRDVTNAAKGWNLWIWPFQPTFEDGQAYLFDGTDDFGVVAHARVTCACTQVGIIVRLGLWVVKDVAQDRFVDTPNQHAEVWLIQGDPTIFTSAHAARGELDDLASPLPSPHHAVLEAPTTAIVSLAHSVDLSGTAPSDFVVADLDTGNTIPVTALADAGTTGLSSSDLVKLTLAHEPNVADRIQVAYTGRRPAPLLPRQVLTLPRYTYTGTDLGAVYSAKATSFRLWAPVANKVVLHLYRNEQGWPLKTLFMKKSTKGTWLLRLKGSLRNVYYDYDVTNLGQTKTVLDPYAVGVAPNGKYCQVVDLGATDPGGWNKDRFIRLGPQTNASIYEVHVRDFSIDPNSGIRHRGTYLAFTEDRTKGPDGVATGVASLKQLGITHVVELLPIQFSAFFDEAAAERTTVAPPGSERYNWNYNPTLWDVPTAAYATTPHGTARISEVKRMVQALHRQHLGVILDLVYEHTSSPWLDQVVPNYYYRTDYRGVSPGQSGVSNDVAAERPMVRQLIVHSVSYWFKEYHVDGMRLDQMSLLGKGTVLAIAHAARAIDPSAVVLGEGYSAQGDPGIIGDRVFDFGAQKGTHVALLDTLGSDVLDGYYGAATAEGYATGASAGASPITGDPNVVSVDSFVQAAIDFTGKGAFPFTQNADEHISLASDHDHFTLWDRLLQDPAATDDATRIKMDELTQAIVVTSQGVPFIQGGDEFLRTKGGDGDSYESGDVVNRLDWSRKRRYLAVFRYYAGLFHLRRAHSAFRMDSPKQVQSRLSFMAGPKRETIVYELKSHANGDAWKNIVVIYNPGPASVTVKLPLGKWTIVATQGRVGTAPLGTTSGAASAPGYSAMILHQ